MQHQSPIKIEHPYECDSKAAISIHHLANNLKIDIFSKYNPKQESSTYWIVHIDDNGQENKSPLVSSLEEAVRLAQMKYSWFGKEFSRLLFIIYMYLPDEQVDVWCPVVAENIEGNIFKIISQHTDEDEIWEFSTGSIVECIYKRLGACAVGKPKLVAYKLSNIE